jgi:hypothetical protein
MTRISPVDIRRPYLVIPKLIKQPTWGGQYIVAAKGWQEHGDLGQLKIGQSYELFSGSNVSLLEDSDDKLFTGELTDNTAVALPTSAPHSRPLAGLIEADAAAVLGSKRSQEHAGKLDLLLKFTQALGNSFQAHIKADLKHPKWLPKPESWYYFEPGLITLGVKPGIDWQAYEACVRNIAARMTELGTQVKGGTLSYEAAQDQISQLLKNQDPWQYVNLVPTQSDDLVDLSSGALHHSWEEDPIQAPMGNVLYELQSEALDAVSTFRNFDKGKMSTDGSIRPIQIDEYYQFINRTPELNDPKSHFQSPRTLTHNNEFRFDRLLSTRFYSLDKLTLTQQGAAFRDDINSFRHIFVKSGRAHVTAGGCSVAVSAGHSAFVPAASGVYEVSALAASTQVLISY